MVMIYLFEVFYTEPILNSHKVKVIWYKTLNLMIIIKLLLSTKNAFLKITKHKLKYLLLII